MKYRVVTGISFRKNGAWVHHQAGQTVELPPDLAQVYVDGGDVEQVSEPKKATKSRST